MLAPGTLLGRTAAPDAEALETLIGQARVILERHALACLRDARGTTRSWHVTEPMTYVSGYDPDTRICWMFCNKGDRHCNSCPVHSAKYKQQELVIFGRCRSGSRWFWTAYTCHEPTKRVDGWVNSEAEAMAAAVAAVRTLSDKLITAVCNQGAASDRLKKLNKAKRAARPASKSKESRPDEYLYSRWGNQFRIIKKTKQRIYYNTTNFSDESAFAYLDYDDDAVGFIPRSRVKAECNFEESSYRTMYLNKPQRPAWKLELPDLYKLKQVMADAHPDRGGSSAAFIDARAEYLEALKRHRQHRKEKV